MACFVIEINIPNITPQNADGSLAAIANIIKSAGGKVVDYGIQAQVLVLIVTAKSELAMIDVLKINAFRIGQIRRICLLEAYPRRNGQKRAKTPSFIGFSDGMDLRNTVVIEIYPH